MLEVHLRLRGPRAVQVRTGRSRREVRVRLLIAIPVHNEAKYVGAVLDKVKRYHDDILVVDDGSTDGTGAILAAREDVQVIRHAVNRGYGQSLIDAFCCAQR